MTKKQGFATRAIHSASPVDVGTGAVTPALHLSTTFERDADGAYPRGFSYSRSENPNRQALEALLTELEGGQQALAFASGMAAINAILQALDPKDEIILADDLYHGTRRVVNDIYNGWGIQAQYLDTTDVPSLREHLSERTRLLWLETPSNPLLKVSDIAEIAAILPEHCLLVVDSTWTTPYLQRPLELGADIVIHSTTKYLGGHSDILGGAAVFKEQGAFSERVATIQKAAGAVASPFDCWLLQRSIKSLPYRMRGHCENAATLADFLQQHPKISKVHFPGLKDHPQHHIARRQMSAFGGMLSIEVGESEADAMRCAARLEVFTRATSLGGIESLIEHRASIEGPDSSTPQNLLRVSVGLEDIDDLIGDFEQALAD